MARLNQDEALVNARIVYWGIEGAGKTTNLQVVYKKLRPDHRGEIESIPTRIDPTVNYEVLPIELGEVVGLRTRIQMIAVPGAIDQAPTRKQLLDQVDGIVLVIDSQAERLEENASSLNELRETLYDYGRRLEDVPLVIQYNKRELSDPFALEELYRRLDVTGAAVFEAVATETTGVLQTLSTVSKRVVRTLRDKRFDVEDDIETPSAQVPPQESVAGSEPVAEPAAVSAPPDFDDPPPTVVDFTPEQPLDSQIASAQRMEQAILAESAHPEVGDIGELTTSTENLFDSTWDEISSEFDESDPSDGLDDLLEAVQRDPVSSPTPVGDGLGPRLGPELSITSVGTATRSGERGVRVPLVVAGKDGRTATLVLSIQLDPLLDGDSD